MLAILGRGGMIRFGEGRAEIFRRADGRTRLAGCVPAHIALRLKKNAHLQPVRSGSDFHVMRAEARRGYGGQRVAGTRKPQPALQQVFLDHPEARSLLMRACRYYVNDCHLAAAPQGAVHLQRPSLQNEALRRLHRLETDLTARQMQCVDAMALENIPLTSLMQRTGLSAPRAQEALFEALSALARSYGFSLPASASSGATHQTVCAPAWRRARSNAAPSARR